MANAASGRGPSGASSDTGPPSVVRRSLPDGIDGLLNEIRQTTSDHAKRHPTGQAHTSLETLDLCGIGLGDANAAKLFEVLTKLQVAAKRVWLSSNDLGPSCVAALSAYLWHSPEPLWELALADNRIGAEGVEELLRCFYNHPSHPPRLPASNGVQQGPAFALKLCLHGNQIQDPEGIVSRVQGHGGPGAVQLAVTVGDGPAPPPAEQAPYLWVFLPRLAEQQARQNEAPRDKDNAEAKGNKRHQGDSRRNKDREKDKDRDRREAKKDDKKDAKGKDEKHAKDKGRSGKEKDKDTRKEKEDADRDKPDKADKQDKSSKATKASKKEPSKRDKKRSRSSSRGKAKRGSGRKRGRSRSRSKSSRSRSKSRSRSGARGRGSRSRDRRKEGSRSKGRRSSSSSSSSRWPQKPKDAWVPPAAQA